MNNKIIVSLVATFLLGLGIGYVAFHEDVLLRGNMHQMPDGSMMHNSEMKHSMDAMMSGLQGKTGDEFDKAFISEMVIHHEGAVEMAQAALKNAKRQEIKDLSNEIINAQTKEIKMMEEWYLEWYE